MLPFMTAWRRMSSLYVPYMRLLPVLALAILAGCSSGASTSGVSTSGVSTATTRTLTASAGLASPGCSTATAAAPSLRGVRTAMLPVTAGPFGVSVTPNGSWAFVSGSGASVIQVFRVTRGSLAPRATGSVRLKSSPLGSTMTPGGQYLLAATGSGAAVIDVARAVTGQRDAVLGTLSDPRLTTAGQDSAIEVAVSPDGNYAFVTDEYADLAAVFNLRLALTRGFGPADYVGSIPLAEAAVGMAVSPDGRWLYATSEVGLHQSAGTLTVISLRRAETDPAGSVVATVDAGCQPVRVVASADGRMVWVDARASDDLLGFSAARLLSEPAHALVSITRVGEAPVGLALVRGGSLIVIADSNRFSQQGAASSLAVVKVAARPALLGYLPAGLFPREMAVEPGGGTLLVTNFASGQLEAVSIPSLP
jgi:DNA-binding beta-propeller fold protein YncE